MAAQAKKKKKKPAEKPVSETSAKPKKKRWWPSSKNPNYYDPRYETYPNYEGQAFGDNIWAMASENNCKDVHFLIYDDKKCENFDKGQSDEIHLIWA